MRNRSATRKNTVSSTKSAKSIPSMGALAKLVERDVGQISRWTKRDDWPFARKAPWPRKDVPEILRWAAEAINTKSHGPESAADSGDEMKALRKDKLRKEIRKLHAQADSAETALSRERGKLYDADEAEREIATLSILVRNGFQNLPSQLVSLALTGGMPHAAAAQFQLQAGEAINGILRHLSRDRTEADDDAPPEVPGQPVSPRAMDAVGVG